MTEESGVVDTVESTTDLRIIVQLERLRGRSNRSGSRRLGSN